MALQYLTNVKSNSKKFQGYINHKTIKSITAVICRKIILTKVIPSIKSKYPVSYKQEGNWKPPPLWWWWRYFSRRLDNMILALQSCQEAAMIAKEGKSYKIFHIEKAKQGERFQSKLSCPIEAVESVTSLLNWNPPYMSLFFA